ncbi:hypothetical protein BJ875DRAFT_193349 [Amylocarpus encephaloides]|uniref:FAD/NAD(P)-binding domain-containing protein n=1 Tax=Amylocarpus encephaloides TaxID=45428 RepID=A0A9P7Y8W3_9HELO|nr:hypothetical protein BJ875DRAFT_193349 [Amylocarpus encephaloides]
MALFNSIVFTIILLLSTSCKATPVPDAPAVSGNSYDVIIVGGGPAGLSALSGLSRVRRKSLLIDSAVYRNGLTRHMHDVIGNDGTVPSEFRAKARDQISLYPTAHMQNGTVTSIVPQDNFTSFLVTDSTRQTYTSKKVILATGLRDILPETPGVKEAWSRGIYWCPWCDGYEHRDQTLGILGSVVDVVGSVLEVETLNRDIYAFVNGTWTNANVAILNQKRPGWETQLKKYGVAIENRTIASINRLQDGAVVHDLATNMEFDRFEVVLQEGIKVQRDAFITNFPYVQASNIGRDIGVKIYGEKMDVDPASMRTAVKGVWAVGDANSDNSTNVPHAMYTGKKAAVFVHVELEREAAATLLDKRNQGDVREIMGTEMEDLWEGLKTK